jgi:dienelactone hydrolase
MLRKGIDVTALRSIDFWPEANLFSYETQRVTAMAPAGGADPGEVAWICARIDPANRESWQHEWSVMAKEVEGLAEAATTTRSRRDAYLRACNYWRQAAFFISFDDPRRLEYHLNSERCFRTAMQWFKAPAEAVEIPYKGSFLSGYLLHPEGETAQPWPVVVFGGTFDSTAEEKYFAVGRRLVEDGFAVLLWDGPGQGMTLLRHHVLPEADQSDAVGATIDWVASRPELDETRVATIGWGAGGYYTLLAAANEPRLAAGIAWCLMYGNDGDAGQPESGNGFSSFEEWKELATAGKLGNPILERYNYDWSWVRAGGDFQSHLELEGGHTLAGALGRVTCPILILMGGEDAVSFHGEGAPSMTDSERVMQELGTSDKTLVRFPAGGPGSRHVQADGMERARAVMADWLTARLLPERVTG